MKVAINQKLQVYNNNNVFKVANDNNNIDLPWRE